MGGEEATDDFEKAILIIFAQSGLVDPNLKVGVCLHSRIAIPWRLAQAHRLTSRRSLNHFTMHVD